MGRSAKRLGGDHFLPEERHTSLEKKGQLDMATQVHMKYAKHTLLCAVGWPRLDPPPGRCLGRPPGRSKLRSVPLVAWQLLGPSGLRRSLAAMPRLPTPWGRL